MAKGKNTTLIVVVAVVLIILVAIAAVVIYYVNGDSVKETTMVELTKNDKNVGEIKDTEYLFNLKNIMSQFESALGTTDANQIMAYWMQAEEGQTRLDQVKEFVLEQVKYQKVEYLEAVNANVKLDSDEKSQLEEEFASIEEQIETQAQMDTNEYFKTNLGISFKQFKRFNEEYTIASKFSSQQVKAIEVSDEDIKAEYDKDPSLYDTVDVRHILVLTTDEEGNSVDEETKKEKEALANEILLKVQAGEDVEALVETYSEDPGKTSNQGKYSVKASSSLAEEFKNWALEAAVGDTGIVETQFGYHVMICENRTEFEAVKLLVKQTIQQREYTEKLESWVEEYEFEVFDSVYDGIDPF